MRLPRTNDPRDRYDAAPPSITIEAWCTALPVITQPEPIGVYVLRRPLRSYGRAMHRAIVRHRARSFYWYELR
jgi:hypothetical protein